MIPIDHRQMNWVTPGMKLWCCNPQGYEGILTLGRQYEAMGGAVEGIFPSRPCVTFQGDDGELYASHLSRFSFDGPNGEKT